MLYYFDFNIYNMVRSAFIYYYKTGFHKLSVLTLSKWMSAVYPLLLGQGMGDGYDAVEARAVAAKHIWEHI